MRLLATEVFVGQIEECQLFCIAFKGTCNEKPFEFYIQIADHFDEQDQALEMSTYSLSDSNGITCYGGLTSYNVVNGQLDMTLTNEAADVFGFDMLQVFFESDTLSNETLSAAFTGLFGKQQHIYQS
jgi:hypothetical protein